MSRLALGSLALVWVVTFTACVDNIPLAPQSGSGKSPSFSASASSNSRGGQGARRHIVTFTGSVPANFDGQVKALGGKVVWVSQGTGLATVSGLSNAAVATLGIAPGVQAVDADGILTLPLPRLSRPDAVGTGRVESNANPAGAVRYARQWNMRAVQADAAWAGGFLGSANVTVYMLDSGIDYLHADLLGRVDLSRSVDLLGTFDAAVEVAPGDTILVPFTEADTVATYFPGRLAITDLLFHGTHTSATVSSNAVRAAGITSGTKLVAVKVCGYIDQCPFSSILAGVIYAADHGADVMNLSLGGSFPKRGNGRFIALIDRTFEYARRKGVTTVVSAGNEALDLDHDPMNYHSFCDTRGVICVSATGPTAEAGINGPWTNVDAPAYYTNFGRNAIDVAAPGGNNNSYVWAACSQTSVLIDCSALPIFILGAQGTSMAAPHVAGAAALLVSILGRHPEAIQERLEKTADQIGSPALRPFYGNGRLNVYKAVTATEQMAQQGSH